MQYHYSNEIWFLDCKQGDANWQLLQPANATAPEARIHHGLVYRTAANSLLVYSGFLQNNTRPHDMWQFLVQTREWKQVEFHATSPAPVARCAFNCHYDEKRDMFYMAFGFDGVYYNDGWWRFDFATSKWSNLQVQDMPCKRSMSFFACSANRMFTINGYSQGSSLQETKFHVYDFDKMVWSETQEHASEFNFAYGYDGHLYFASGRMYVGYDVNRADMPLMLYKQASKSQFTNVCIMFK